MHTCGYSAAENADFVQRSSWVDLGNATSMDNGEFAKCGCAEKVVDGLSINEEACLAVVEHHPPVGIYPEEITHVALLRFTMATLSAFPGENGQDVVARLEISHTLTHTLHNSDYTHKKT